MNIPNMILFDYGQTLVSESFDGIRGTEAVLQYAVKNKYQKSAAEVQAEADAMNRELGRFDPKRRHLFQIEVPNSMFAGYLYESQGIELSIQAEEIDRVFWEAAAPGMATEGIEEFLKFLDNKGIRTGVISNIAYCRQVVEERIRHCLPNHTFEFILTSSAYLYRKPHRRIFELALEKAGLKPEEVWYIGDQYECDIVGAAGAGLFPVWYTGALEEVDIAEKENGRKTEVLVVNSWAKLKEIMISEMEV